MSAGAGLVFGFQETLSRTAEQCLYEMSENLLVALGKFLEAGINQLQLRAFFTEGFGNNFNKDRLRK